MSELPNYVVSHPDKSADICHDGEAACDLSSNDLTGSNFSVRGFRHSGWMSLTLWISGILAVWLVVLPEISQTDSVSRRMLYFESRGIDPSARYYTDQAAGWQNAKIIQDKIKRSPEAFWSFENRESFAPAVPESSN